MLISVVVPVYNGGDDFPALFNSLASSHRKIDQLIVVDDGSTDGSHRIAQNFGAKVITVEHGPKGPANARNLGASAAIGDVVVFLDADVAVHADTIEKIHAVFSKHPEIDALFGSYDDQPKYPGLVSRYKNLFHHYVHQHGLKEATTFWTGCGAIRREVFEKTRGFDKSYQRPILEDIELGYRLRAKGFRIWLCPDIQVTHLKRWTFTSLLRSDIFDRALNWSRLIVKEKHIANDLNLDFRNRFSALMALGALFFFFLGWVQPVFWWGTLFTLGALVVANRELYRFFYHKGGWLFALSCAGLHLLYLIYSSVTFIFVAAAWKIKAVRR